MSYSHGSITLFVPAAIAPEVIVDKSAMTAFAERHKETLVEKLKGRTDGGFADLALEALSNHLSADSLRDLIDTADNDSWRFTYHRGAQLKQIADELQKVLDWVAANPIAARDRMDFPDQSFRYSEEQMRDAITSNLISADPANDPRVNDGFDGWSPWYVFTYWRTLRATYEDAWREQAAVVRYMYVA